MWSLSSYVPYLKINKQRIFWICIHESAASDLGIGLYWSMDTAKDNRKMQNTNLNPAWTSVICMKFCDFEPRGERLKLVWNVEFCDLRICGFVDRAGAFRPKATKEPLLSKKASKSSSDQNRASSGTCNAAYSAFLCISSAHFSTVGFGNHSKKYIKNIKHHLDIFRQEMQEWHPLFIVFI